MRQPWRSVRFGEQQSAEGQAAAAAATTRSAMHQLDTSTRRAITQVLAHCSVLSAALLSGTRLCRAAFAQLYPVQLHCDRCLHATRRPRCVQAVTCLHASEKGQVAAHLNERRRETLSSARGISAPELQEACTLLAVRFAAECHEYTQDRTPS